jgi:hypothetical protein
VRDVSRAYLRARIWQIARVYTSSYVTLRTPGAECKAAAKIDPRTIAIRYGLHRYSIEDGILTWGSVETVRTLDCNDPSR